jgi:uncharacterized protein YcaQ
MHLTPEKVRSTMLAAQGLLSAPDSAPQKADLLPTIRQMGYLQIDTIQAVRRSQNLVLWSRLGDIDPAWLDQVHAEGGLFEYYAHALCYLPIEDYPIFRGLMLNDNRTGNGWQSWAEEHPEVVNRIRTAVEKFGPVSSSDFNSETISTGWGDVKHEKLALSRLFSTGELMVPYRKKFRRFYDLRERVLPGWDDAQALDVRSAQKLLVLKTIRALGVAREDWVAPYYYLLKTGLSDMLAELVAEGSLRSVRVDEWGLPAYFHPEQAALVEAAAQGDLQPNHTTFLSPFDPLVSDRDRALNLFNFDYRLECYTPVKDRQYGYFCLPILHDGRLIGRLDPKAHRKEKRMEIKHIYLEEDIALTDHLVTELKRTLEKFTTWHGMTTFEISGSTPPILQEALL